MFDHSTARREGETFAEWATRVRKARGLAPKVEDPAFYRSFAAALRRALSNDEPTPLVKR